MYRFSVTCFCCFSPELTFANDPEVSEDEVHLLPKMENISHSFPFSQTCTENWCARWRNMLADNGLDLNKRTSPRAKRSCRPKPAISA